MLSAVIPSGHSYPAMLLAEQPVHQRSSLSGPLVTYSHITMCADYIFTRPKSLKQLGLGVGVLWQFICHLHLAHCKDPVDTGSNLKFSISSLFVLFLLVT